MVYNSFDKKIGSGARVNEDLAEELHKPVIKEFKRRKVYCFRFMNDTMIIKIFNNCNIAYIIVYINNGCQIMTTIKHIILKVESLIKKLIVTNHTFFGVATLSKNNSFAYINSITIQHL